MQEIDFDLNAGAVERAWSKQGEPGEQLADDYHVEAELIRHAMETERLYADPGLTIGRLASHLGQQEYRLRRLINRKLGYRNFNHCLNHYRRYREKCRVCLTYVFQQGVQGDSWRDTVEISQCSREA